MVFFLQFVSSLAVCFAAVLILMIPFVNFAIIKRRNDVADIMWGLSFIVIAWSSRVYSHNTSNLSLIIDILISIWGLRLSYHITKRWLRFKEEERRYSEMRSTWKKNEDLNTFTVVFLLQAVLAILVSIPVILINTYANQTKGYFYLGIAIWIFGFTYEAISDMQLKKFIQNPDNKGQIMKIGLFKYSRHPNYFGELTQWWAIAFMCFSVDFGYLGVLGAFAITLLINKVSGVPLAEKSTSKKPGWEEYSKKTPPIIPKIP